MFKCVYVNVLSNSVSSFFQLRKCFLDYMRFCQIIFPLGLFKCSLAIGLVPLAFLFVTAWRPSHSPLVMLDLDLLFLWFVIVFPAGVRNSLRLPSNILSFLWAFKGLLDVCPYVSLVFLNISKHLSMCCVWFAILPLAKPLYAVQAWDQFRNFHLIWTTTIRRTPLTHFWHKIWKLSGRCFEKCIF